MKISKSQKDAVMSLLIEKFEDKQIAANEKFLKEHKQEIDDAIADFKKDEEKVEQLLSEAKTLIGKWRNSEIINDNIKVCYYWDYDTEKTCVNKHKEIVVKYPKIETPDFSKVERQLELDSLSKEFDVDKFIKKYLGK